MCKANATAGSSAATASTTGGSKSGKRKWEAPNQIRHRTKDADTVVVSLLKGQVEFTCLRCSSCGGHRAKTIKKRSLKKHRTGDGCKAASKWTDDSREMTRAAPPPLSAEEALAQVRNVMRSGI